MNTYIPIDANKYVSLTALNFKFRIFFLKYSPVKRYLSTYRYICDSYLSFYPSSPKLNQCHCDLNTVLYRNASTLYYRWFDYRDQDFSLHRQKICSISGKCISWDGTVLFPHPPSKKALSSKYEPFLYKSVCFFLQYSIQCMTLNHP